MDKNTFEEYIERYKIPVIERDSLSFGERLGHGAIWTVHKGTVTTSETSSDVAVKRLNLSIPQTYSDVAPYSLDLREQLAIASLEIRALTTPALRSHRNVANLVGVSWEDVGPLPDARASSKRPLLIMELAMLSCPTLEALYRPGAAAIDLDVKCALIADISDALGATHDCGIIHGDLKPGNILLFPGAGLGDYTAKISDFGGCQPSAAEQYDPSQISADLEIFPLAGTRIWNAPEVSQPGHPHFRSKFRDYYSLGLVIYFILFEAMPSHHIAEDTQHQIDPDEDVISALVTRRIVHLVDDQTLHIDSRYLVLSLAIVVLLRHEPDKRAKDRFARDCRAFLKDKELGTYLRSILRHGKWGSFIRDYLHGKRDLWDVSSTISAGRAFLSRRPELAAHALSPVPLGDALPKDLPEAHTGSSLLGAYFDAPEAENLLRKVLHHMPKVDEFIAMFRQHISHGPTFIAIAVNACLCEVSRVSSVPLGVTFARRGTDWDDLIASVVGSDVNGVEYYLQQASGDISSCIAGGMNVLQLAARVGFRPTVELLLSDGRIDVNARTEEGLDALTLALNALHSDIARLLWEHGSSVSVALNLGTLGFLANYGNFDCLSFLEELLCAHLENEACREAKIRSFWNAETGNWPTLSPEVPYFHPVVAAILGGNSASLWFLLDRGSATNVEFNFTVNANLVLLKPIHVAGLLRPLHLALLLHYGTDPTSQTSSGKESEPFGHFTALHLACTAPGPASYLFAWAEKKHVDEEIDPEAWKLDGDQKNLGRLACFKLLLTVCPALINVKDKAGLTVLAHAMSAHADKHADNVAMVTLLLAHGADCSAVDAQNLSCLHRACIFNQDIRLVKLLLERGVPLEARDVNGYTPLMAAAEHGRVSFVRLLLANGADVRARSRLNYDMLSLMFGARQFETLEILFDAAEEQGALDEILRHKDYDSEQTILVRLCRSPEHHPFLLRFSSSLITQHVNDTDLMNFTALHVAAAASNVQAAKTLLACGADVNAQGYNGLTASHFAYGMGQTDLIGLLHDWHPDLSLRDSTGWTPADYGAQRRLRLSFWDDIMADIMRSNHAMSTANFDLKYSRIVEKNP